ITHHSIPFFPLEPLSAKVFQKIDRHVRKCAALISRFGRPDPTKGEKPYTHPHIALYADPSSGVINSLRHPIKQENVWRRYRSSDERRGKTEAGKWRRKIGHGTLNGHLRQQLQGFREIRRPEIRRQTDHAVEQRQVDETGEGDRWQEDHYHRHRHLLQETEEPESHHHAVLAVFGRPRQKQEDRAGRAEKEDDKLRSTWTSWGGARQSNKHSRKIDRHLEVHWIPQTTLRRNWKGQRDRRPKRPARRFRIRQRLQK
ncbi:unnamed protein product, partial [Callosobruchus maculatus]